MSESRTKWITMVVLIAIALAGYFLFIIGPGIAGLQRINLNARLLGDALRQHQRLTGTLPKKLEDLVHDGGHVTPGYLDALTNRVVVFYTPGESNASNNVPILRLSGYHHSATVTRDFQVHVFW